MYTNVLRKTLTKPAVILALVTALTVVPRLIINDFHLANPTTLLVTLLAVLILYTLQKTLPVNRFIVFALFFSLEPFFLSIGKAAPLPYLLFLGYLVSDKYEALRTYVRGILTSFGGAKDRHSATASQPRSFAKEDKKYKLLPLLLLPFIFSKHGAPSLYYLNLLYNTASEGLFLGVMTAGYFLVKDFKKGALAVSVYKSLLFTVSLYLLLELSAPKSAVNTAFLFPFAILAASYGYFRVEDRILRYLVLASVIFVMIIKSLFLFPDLVLYKNSLSLDFSYSNAHISSIAGMYKLGRFLHEKLGSDRNIFIDNPDRLKMYYRGQLRPSVEFNCEKSGLVLVSEQPDVPLCKVHKEPSETFRVSDVLFYIFTT